MERVNLYSDTQTRPTPGMRQAIAEAEVGDEQRFMDPTVNALQERVAELLGHEAALFLPTGTMCNEIAVPAAHPAGRRRDVCDRTAHPIIAEAGGPGGVCRGDDAAARRRRRHLHRRAGARARSATPATATSRARGWCRSSRPPTWAAAASGRSRPIEAVVAVARENELRAHLDGARLMNAVVASGVAAADYAAQFDTAWLDFSKGLGAPVRRRALRVAPS